MFPSNRLKSPRPSYGLVTSEILMLADSKSLTHGEVGRRRPRREWTGVLSGRATQVLKFTGTRRNPRKHEGLRFGKTNRERLALMNWRRRVECRRRALAGLHALDRLQARRSASAQRRADTADVHHLRGGLRVAVLVSGINAAAPCSPVLSFIALLL
jgi:hypothetical protein